MNKRRSAILAALAEVSEGSVHALELAQLTSSIDHSGPSADALRSLSRSGNSKGKHTNHTATAVVGGVLRAPSIFAGRPDAPAGEKTVLSTAAAAGPAAKSLATTPSVGAALQGAHHQSDSIRGTSLMGGGLIALVALVLGLVLTAGTWIPVLMSIVGFLAGSKIATAIFGTAS